MHLEKARAVVGDVAKPFEVTLIQDDRGGLAWTYRELEDVRLDQVLQMTEDGLSQTEIAKEFGVNKSTVCRWLKKDQEKP